MRAGEGLLLEVLTWVLDIAIYNNPKLLLVEDRAPVTMRGHLRWIGGLKSLRAANGRN